MKTMNVIPATKTRYCIERVRFARRHHLVHSIILLPVSRCFHHEGLVIDVRSILHMTFFRHDRLLLGLASCSLIPRVSSSSFQRLKLPNNVLDKRKTQRSLEHRFIFIHFYVLLINHFL